MQVVCRFWTFLRKILGRFATVIGKVVRVGRTVPARGHINESDCVDRAGAGRHHGSARRARERVSTAPAQAGSRMPRACAYNERDAMAGNRQQKIRMVAGLGNPDPEYAETRHNAGFATVDELARRGHVTYWKNQSGADVATVKVNDPDDPSGVREVLLVKPQSYMNTSGGPISKLCAANRIKPEELLVIHDELELNPGTVQIKIGGGHAGHNGLRSIIDKLGNRDFVRVRVGIGKPPGRMPGADYVLRRLKGRDLEEFQDAVMRAADACEVALAQGAEQALKRVGGTRGQGGKR